MNAATFKRAGLYLLAAIAGGVITLLTFWFTREAKVGRVWEAGPDAAPVIADTAFLEALSRFADAQWTTGGAEVLLNGDGTFPRLWQDLRAARRSITFTDFWLQTGAPADTLAAILAERARAGVRVLFLYDAYGTDVPEAYFPRLRDAGVTVAELRPLSFFRLAQAQHRSHVRAVVVDGVVGYTGGFGIDPRWLGNGRAESQWRDTNVRLTGELVTQLQAVFLTTWAEATGQLLTGEPFYAPGDDDAAGNVARGAVVYSPATIGSTAAERLLALILSGTRSRVYLTSAYFAPEDDLVRLLARAARRGVDVRILVPGEHTDQPLARRAGRASYEQLLRAGVRLYEYEPTMVHAKTLVADGTLALVGTINLDNRSLALNDEVTLVAVDRTIARTLETQFAADLAHARPISLESFARRSWWQRVRERAASLALRLL